MHYVYLPLLHVFHTEVIIILPSYESLCQVIDTELDLSSTAIYELTESLAWWDR